MAQLWMAPIAGLVNRRRDWTLFHTERHHARGGAHGPVLTVNCRCQLGAIPTQFNVLYHA